jgi:hypothetical protein
LIFSHCVVKLSFNFSQLVSDHTRNQFNIPATAFLSLIEDRHNQSLDMRRKIESDTKNIKKESRSLLLFSIIIVLFLLCGSCRWWLGAIYMLHYYIHFIRNIAMYRNHTAEEFWLTLFFSLVSLLYGINVNLSADWS